MKTIFIYLLFSFTYLFSQEYDVSIYLGAEKEALHHAKMIEPFHVAFDSKDNMYIVEYKGSRLDILDNQGQFKQLGGDGTWNFSVENGPVENAQFKGLHNIIIDDSDNVYISDTFNDRCRMYNPKNGTISTFIGSGKKGYNTSPSRALDSKFNELYNVVFNQDKSKIIIADLKNNRVRELDIKTNTVTTIAGNGKKGIPKDGDLAINAPLMNPRSVAVDSKGLIYIADRAGHALRVIKNGKIYTLVNKPGKKGIKLGNGVDAQLFGPKYVTTDADDNVWIADDQNHRICLYNIKTKMLTSVIGKQSPIKNFKLNRPHGLAIHKNGTIFVADSNNHRILKLVKK